MTPEAPPDSSNSDPIEDRRTQPLLRFWVTWGPVVTAFVAGMSLYDPLHAHQWGFAAVICASLSGGSRGPAIFKGK